MHDVRTRTSRRQGTAGRKRDTAPQSVTARAGQAPAFPVEIRVPPHRGAVIVTAAAEPADPRAADAFCDGAEAQRLSPAPPPRKRRAKPAATAATTAPIKRAAAQPRASKTRAGKTRAGKTPAGQAQTPKTRDAPAAKPRTRKPPAPAPAEPARPRQRRPAATRPAVPLPPATEALVVPAAPAAQPVGAAETAAPPTALPRNRALVRSGGGLVARVVAWLDRLVPRRRRAALPRARTRLDRSARQDPAGHVAAARTGPPGPESAADLARRMLLQLSEENERLRREIERLRATADEPGR